MPGDHRGVYGLAPVGVPFKGARSGIGQTRHRENRRESGHDDQDAQGEAAAGEFLSRPDAEVDYSTCHFLLYPVDVRSSELRK